jgi:hypothetical protein
MGKREDEVRKLWAEAQLRIALREFNEAVSELAALCALPYGKKLEIVEMLGERGLKRPDWDKLR